MPNSRAPEVGEAAEEDAAASEPADAPAHPVEVFWTLAQHFKRTGVNVERVAHDAVASMTPAT